MAIARTRKKWQWFSLLGAAATVWAQAGLAAEQISLVYPPFGTFNIQVSDLATFAKTGNASSELRFLIRLLPNAQESNLREGLTTRMDLEPTTVSQFVKSPIGQSFLERIGQVIRADNDVNGGPALGEALKTAASSPAGITLLSVLQAFPGKSVKVNGELGLKAVGAFTRAVNQEQRAQDFIERLAQLQPRTPLPASGLNPAQKGPFQWQKQKLEFTNPNRTTGLIPADLYVPIGMIAPAPLIVISHGLASDRTTFAYLAEHLASHGLAVLAVTHPGSDASRINSFLSGAPLDYENLPKDWAQRPLDLKFGVDAVAALVQKNPALKIDTNNVGLFGHSMGGFTVLAAAGGTVDWNAVKQRCLAAARDLFIFNISVPLQCRSLGLAAVPSTPADPRVRSVIAVNPVSSILIGERGMANIKVPTLIVSSSRDVFAPPLEEQIWPFTWLQAQPKYLAMLVPGTHFSAVGVSEAGVLPVPNDLIGPNPQLAQPFFKGLAGAFFGVFNQKNESLRPFLSQTFVNQVTQPTFQAYWVDRINPQQLQEVLAGRIGTQPRR
ncbi:MULTISPECIES: alpha/beta hydrolase [unclassified Thermosynechococcus]|uniref:alpha/beta hydrolase n=1 Tax=unclassified Thermosynechococcus TaxID=2622553 RepID=UPI00197E9CF1|nr:MULTISPECIES: alpha/beta hydrolase [unclassified Thermosynechococcus]MDR5639279.1 alpha/beta fold hydrolase [Thermosynechococcus sp. PP42]QSF48166.1 alpha/beta hydrolase [Thermosynechococcus sp. TA-1]WKT80118.1 alpha/beta fold hydrolase [Thermosynechococcus sp. PP45]WNC21185.1 alpha/beta fold hydrolase [Thermosynechococcus sp. PP22]WNC23728.1 alpha/beta fold hydrolase [Thermosynechococcus sp. PP551]